MEEPAKKKSRTTSQTGKNGKNGESFIVGGGAAGALATYPHMRRVNGYLHVSGTSSRRSDNTHVGATKKEDGTWELDIEAQTTAVLENIERILSTAGADLSHAVEVTCFLTDMVNYKGFNKSYNKFFTDPGACPTRTTVAVHQLPHPNLLIEIKCLAVDPKAGEGVPTPTSS